jgi:hypothetical protein
MNRVAQPRRAHTEGIRPFGQQPQAPAGWRRPHTFAAAAPHSLTLCHPCTGTKLIVVQQSPGSFCAVSKRRDLGISARHLPCGVLLASFSWPVPAQRVECALDGCCATLRA